MNGTLNRVYCYQPTTDPADPPKTVPLLPAEWKRTAGLALVILGGSLGQEISFLFGLLSVQRGVNLKENRDFVRPAYAKVGS